MVWRNGNGNALAVSNPFISEWTFVVTRPCSCFHEPNLNPIIKLLLPSLYCVWSLQYKKATTCVFYQDRGYSMLIWIYNIWSCYLLFYFTCTLLRLKHLPRLTSHIKPLVLHRRGGLFTSAVIPCNCFFFFLVSWSRALCLFLYPSCHARGYLLPEHGPPLLGEHQTPDNLVYP